jgi:hypothetical protein
MMKRCMVVGGIVLLFLAGCATQYPRNGYVYHGVRTRISDAIMLYPVPVKGESIYIRVINKTKLASLDNVRRLAVKTLTSEGYKVTNSASKASFRVRLTMLYAGITSVGDATNILVQGYDGSIRPSGETIIGKRVYNKTRIDDMHTYLVVADLHVSLKKIKMVNTHVTPQFNQRIVSTYSRYFLNPVSFAEIQPAFSLSVARQIERIF